MWHALWVMLQTNQHIVYQCYWVLRTDCVLCRPKLKICACMQFLGFYLPRYNNSSLVYFTLYIWVLMHILRWQTQQSFFLFQKSNLRKIFWWPRTARIFGSLQPSPARPTHIPVAAWARLDISYIWSFFCVLYLNKSNRLWKRKFAHCKCWMPVAQARERFAVFCDSTIKSRFMIFAVQWLFFIVLVDIYT